MQIKDSVFLITGSSSGLGEATAIKLLQSNAKVVGVDVQEPNNELFKRFVNDFTFVKADVTSEKEILDVLKLVKTKYGRLNGVVNCAGVVELDPIYDFETNTPVSLEKVNRIIQINLLGTINVIRLAIGLIKDNQPNEEEERGVIINTGSIAGIDGMIKLPAYVASKAGVNGLTLNLARDLAVKGIRVVTIAPGVFNTPLVKDFLQNTDLCHVVFPRKVGEPEKFGQMVVAIVENVMLNGSVLRLDGAQCLGVQDYKLLK